MLTNFMTVAEQVAILFILICIGALAGKTKLIRKEAIPSLNNFVLFVVTTSVIIKSFCREFDTDRLKGLIIAVCLAIFAHIINIFIATIVIKDKEKSKQNVLRFATVFSNCGFMAIPLQSAILGDDGVFYGAVYVAVFNIACWTYGLITMSGGKKNLSIRKIFINPGVVGVTIGMIIFVFSINLPDIIYMPLSYVAALNTPLPMIIIGFMLYEIISAGKTEIKEMLMEKKVYIAIFIRLIVMPLIMFGLMLMLKVDRLILLSNIICVSAPVAATTSMFAEKFGGDKKLSVASVGISTIISLITMPVIVSLAM